MRVIRAIIFSTNLFLWIALDIFFWATCDWRFGLAGFIAIVAWWIGFSNSSGMTVSIRDLYRLPEIDVFKKKVAYANGCAFAAFLIVYLICYITI